MPGSVLLDTDPCLGSPTQDVDDVLALVHLLAHGVHVAGITTCFGNASVDRVNRTARALGRRFDIDVHPGARDPSDTDTEAVARLLDHQGTVVAIAPLTNIAAALARGAQWERLIVLGGTDRRLPNLRPLHTTELNFAVDEDAARVVLRHCTDLVPMEVCRTMWLGRSELAAAPAWLRRGCRPWLWTSPLRTGRLAFHPWDLLAAMVLTHPGALQRESLRPVLHSGPGWRGRIAYEPGDTAVVRTVDLDVAASAWAATLSWLHRR